MAVLLETTLGDVVIDLYTEERPRGEARAPLTPGLGREPASPLFPLCFPTFPRATGWSAWCPPPHCSISGPRLEKFFREENSFESKQRFSRISRWPAGAGRCAHELPMGDVWGDAGCICSASGFCGFTPLSLVLRGTRQIFIGV